MAEIEQMAPLIFFYVSPVVLNMTCDPILKSSFNRLLTISQDGGVIQYDFIFVFAVNRSVCVQFRLTNSFWSRFAIAFRQKLSKKYLFKMVEIFKMATADFQVVDKFYVQMLLKMRLLTKII
jgi:hypothetical protein